MNLPPPPHTPMPHRRALLAAALGSAALLAACATANPAGSGFGKPPVAVAPAGFRLQGVRVVWQDNPGFTYQLTYAVSRYAADKSAPPGLKARADEHMKTIIGLFRTHAGPLLGEELARARTPAGPTHTVVLTPLSGYQHASGQGTGVVVRATIIGADGVPLWKTDIDSFSGLQWFGPALSKPDDSYVRNFVASLMDTFRKAGLVAPGAA